MSLFSSPTAAKPIEDPRRKRLEELEQLIAPRLEHFIMVGRALAEIRDTQLYKLTSTTFADYVESRWGITARRAYQLIAGANKVAEIIPDAPAPTAATAAAHLARLTPEQRDVVKDTFNGKAPKKKRRRPKTIRLRVPGGVVTIERTKDTFAGEQMLRDALTKLAAQNSSAAA